MLGLPRESGVREPKAGTPERKECMHATSDTAVRASSRWFLVAAVAMVIGGGLVVASFSIGSNSGGAGGTADPGAFLTSFQETGVLSAATPNPAPAVASKVVATPTRLPGAGASYLANAGVAGDEAIEWTFSETVGVALNLEIEVAFTVQYTIGAVSHTGTATVYLETQAAAIGATLTFHLYWDSGAAAGVTFVSESQISEACSAVGSCP